MGGGEAGQLLGVLFTWTQGSGVTTAPAGKASPAGPPPPSSPHSPSELPPSCLPPRPPALSAGISEGFTERCLPKHVAAAVRGGIFRLFVFYSPPPALPRAAPAQPPAGPTHTRAARGRGPPGEAGPGAARAAAAQLSPSGGGQGEEEDERKAAALPTDLPAAAPRAGRAASPQPPRPPPAPSQDRITAIRARSDPSAPHLSAARPPKPPLKEPQPARERSHSP